MPTDRATELRSHLDALASHLDVWQGRDPETSDSGAARLAATDAVSAIDSLVGAAQALRSDLLAEARSYDAAVARTVDADLDDPRVW